MKKGFKKIIIALLLCLIFLLLVILVINRIIENKPIKEFNDKVGSVENKYIIRVINNMKVDDNIYYKHFNDYYSSMGCTIIDPVKEKAYIAVERIMFESGEVIYAFKSEMDIAKDDINTIIDEYNKGNIVLENTPINRVEIEYNGEKINTNFNIFDIDRKYDNNLVKVNYNEHSRERQLYEQDKASGTFTHAR